MASTSNPDPIRKISSQTNVGSTGNPHPIRKISSQGQVEPSGSQQPVRNSQSQSLLGRNISIPMGDGAGTSPAENGTAQGFVPKALGYHLLLILSGMYGLFIVTLGAILPVAETFAPDKTQPYMFESFYVYLYLASVGFMLYVYLYLLRKSDYELVRTISRKFRSTVFRSVSNDSASSGKRNGSPMKRKASAGSRLNSMGSMRGRRRRMAYHEQPNGHTGSFYLRLGAIIFGAGSMIHSGLNVGHYFEIGSQGSPCSDVIQGVKPITHLLFTFVQMYFIFMNSKLCVNTHKTFNRFGFMHMCGTNICVWLRAIVVETLFNMRKKSDVTGYGDIIGTPVSPSSLVSSSVTPNAVTYATEHESGHHDTEGVVLHHFEEHDDYYSDGFESGESGSLPELECNWETVMGRVLGKSASYLYPCSIQFSLICACVMYVMWHQVGTEPKNMKRVDSYADTTSIGSSVFTETEDSDDEPRVKPMSVDCGGSSRGLFLGLLLLVMSVVMLVCFYVLASSPQRMGTASLTSHLTECLIYIFTLVAVFAASWQMRNMRISRVRGFGLDQTLILVSLTGLIAFAAFNIVAAVFSPHSQDGVLTVVSNLLMLIQGCCQAVFMLAAVHVKPANSNQVRRMPGKQCVTFLLVSNFALWAVTTFGVQFSEHNHLQEQFYGRAGWSVFCHVSVPLGIYYRFHSTVCLSNVWKNAWKVRPVE